MRTTNNGRNLLRSFRSLAARSRMRLRDSPRSVTCAALGAGLGVLTTLGFLFVRALAVGHAPAMAAVLDDFGRQPASYAYVSTSSLLVGTGLGWLLGRWCDRALLLSITDPLTGVFNRRHFGERLSSEMSRSRRSGAPTCVLCLDLDHLKAINDGFGHQAGDEALVRLAESVCESVRPTDVVARFGGDEFAVLLPDTNTARAVEISDRILAEVALRRLVSTVRSEVSIGIAELGATANSEDVLAMADTALYRAKTNGGGHAVIAQPGVHWECRQVVLDVPDERRR